MRLPKFRWSVLLGAVVGAVVPLLTFTVPAFQELIATGRGIFLWPSAMWLMATDGQEHTIFAYEVIGISVLANILLYTIAFSILWFAGWILSRGRAALRDGPTI